MKVSLKATGYLFQPVHKVDASGTSIYLLKKGQLMRMSWLKELNECCLKITVKSPAGEELIKVTFGQRGGKKQQHK